MTNCEKKININLSIGGHREREKKSTPSLKKEKKKKKKKTPFFVVPAKEGENLVLLSQQKGEHKFALKREKVGTGIPIDYLKNSN